MTINNNRICVVGLGYVGLPTAVTLAANGAEVLGYDINETAVMQINKGLAPIIEADLDGLLHKVVEQGGLNASTQLDNCSAYLIAVPTPVKKDNKPDLGAVFSAVRSIAKVLEKGALVVLESTSPIGTTDKICEMMAELRPDLSFPHQKPENSDVMIAFCPERILPGRTLYELVHNDRVVGGIDKKSALRAQEVYRIFCVGDISVTTAKTAELIKCTENAYRDVNIAFANELSMICAELGLSIEDVISMANKHPRVNILQPGCGVGGHCIPIDPWFIVDAAPHLAKLIRTAREVNLAKSVFVAEDIARQADLKGLNKVTLLGLAYKPDVDDLRESPSLQICKVLLENKGLNCVLVEPHVESLPEYLVSHPNANHMPLDKALDESELLAVLVPHKIFERVSQTTLPNKTILDYTGRA